MNRLTKAQRDYFMRRCQTIFHSHQRTIASMKADAHEKVSKFEMDPSYFSHARLLKQLKQDLKLKDDQVTGTLKLTWFMNDRMMTYLSASNGYKAGGTNTDRIYPQFSQVFGPETSESIELGFKGDLGERFRLQVALYNTGYDDFQANYFIENLGPGAVRGDAGWSRRREALGLQ